MEDIRAELVKLGLDADDTLEWQIITPTPVQPQWLVSTHNEQQWQLGTDLDTAFKRLLLLCRGLETASDIKAATTKAARAARYAENIKAAQRWSATLDPADVEIIMSGQKPPARSVSMASRDEAIRRMTVDWGWSAPQIAQRTGFSMRTVSRARVRTGSAYPTR